MADGRHGGAALAILAVLISLTTLLFGEGILKDLMQGGRSTDAPTTIIDPADATTTFAPATSLKEPTTTSRAASTFTAMELFGAASGNGTCKLTSKLSKYDVETVHCVAGEYDRYFYKYTSADPDGWLSEVIRCGCFTNVRKVATSSCYDTYSANNTIGGETYTTALVLYQNASFVARVSARVSDADSETVLKTRWYTTHRGALC